MMQYELALIEQGEETDRFLVKPDETIVGRSDDACILIEGKTISRNHLRLWVEGGVLSAEDLGSRNGFKINGVRTRSGSLTIGDRMEVGQHLFLVTDKDNSHENADSSGKNGGSVPTFQQQTLQNGSARSDAAKIKAYDLQHLIFDLDALLKEIAKIVLATVPAKRFHVLARTAEHPDLRVLAMHTMRGHEGGPGINPTVIERVHREGTPMILSDVAQQGGSVGDDSPKSGTMCAPLLGRRGRYGLLYVDSSWEKSRFVTTNLEDLKVFGAVFGRLIESALEHRDRLGHVHLRAADQVTGALTQYLTSFKANDERSSLERLKRFEGNLSAHARTANLDPDAINVNQTITEVIDGLGPFAIAANVQFDYRKDARAIAFVDEFCMRVLVRNLLIRAVQASKTGGRIVAITTENQTDGCHIVVKDSGKTATGHESEIVTTEFYQAQSSGLRDFDLATCGRIARAHGGSLRVQSSPGEATTYIAILPQQKSVIRNKQN